MFATMNWTFVKFSNSAVQNAGWPHVKKIIIVVDIVNGVILGLGKCNGDLLRRHRPLVDFVELEHT